LELLEIIAQFQPRYWWRTLTRLAGITAATAAAISWMIPG
jgi:hypothetical protein